ncbi:DUF2716 domain-containing protein [Bacillus altitudinis]|uniref:DUF2716 domain-containing protein n=1 Tax=Bacillus altitudinis TaxID=293387 RepID=UPI0024097750|nr:DUF2716 domain-containing protein [Bacillus altitudinis]WEZ69740.1 DUF2716 domain-containing protein [Bacillus altitudinis]
MENWIPLTDKELKYAWKSFDQEFKFKPSISRFPGFQALSPYITYDISGEWRVPVLPNGDDYFFLSKEITRGLLGHPWEQSITIFGEGLIDSFTRHRPFLFQRKKDNSKNLQMSNRYLQAFFYS